MTEWVGKMLGKVRIERLIARGGMAEVYYGIHTTLERPVAVKVMLSHLEGEPELQARFQREARVLASLRHANIVQIYDFDVAEGQPYIVMEYVPGVSLASYLRVVHESGGRLTLKEVGRFLVMLAAALDAAHTQGVIHRDVKPANVLITDKIRVPNVNEPLSENAEAVLTDFGLLRLVDSAAQTASGVIAGTPSYMSPEQARGERVDHRSDIYSLGVLLYELLAGRVPFEADTSMAVLLKHLQEPPPPIPDLPVALQIVLDRALDKKPENRYQTAREMARAFLDGCGLSMVDVLPGYSSSLSNIDRLPPVSRLNDMETLPFRKTLAPQQPGSSPALPSVSTEASTLPPAPQTVPASGAKRPLWIAGVVIGVVILVGLVLLLSGPLGAALAPASTPTVEPSTTPAPTDTPLPVAPSATHDSAEPAHGAAGDDTATYGTLRFYNVAAFLDEVILVVDQLPQPPADMQYEAWLVGEESSRRTLGLVQLDESGRAELTFLDEQGRNLLARYHRLEITLEPLGDTNPNVSDNVAYSSGIPPMALAHLKHLFVSFVETPNEAGLLVGLVTHSHLVDENAQAMLSAYQSKDGPGVQRRAEAIYNLLVGKQGQGYGDVDQNGTTEDPGDGYGLLLNGDSAGYIGGTASHAGFAMDMADASENIKLHGAHVVISAKNVEGWTSELRELTLQIIADPLGAETNTLIRQAVALSDRILNGRDLNGNERIEPVEGEGGVMVVLEHADYMIDMPVLEGPNRLPPAVGEGEEIELPANYGP